jgi:hypothetical protein
MQIPMQARLRTMLPLLALIGAALVATTVAAETVTGKINGHGCAHGGHTCPADKLDPHVAFEPDFVLQQADGEYYFLSNVPRETKVRHVLEEARATGEVNDRYNTMVVDELQVKEDGSYKTVWSQKAQQAAFDRIYKDGWFVFSGEAPAY